MLQTRARKPYYYALFAVLSVVAFMCMVAFEEDMFWQKSVQRMEKDQQTLVKQRLDQILLKSKQYHLAQVNVYQKHIEMLRGQLAALHLLHKHTLSLPRSSQHPQQPSTVTKRLALQVELNKHNLALDGRPNVLFIGLPRSGRSVITTMLTGQVSTHFAWANIFQDEVNTCGKPFNQTVVGKRRDLSLQLFAPRKSACYTADMVNARYWYAGKEPFALAIMRNPIHQFSSAHRFLVDCCRKQLAWCKTTCPNGEEDLTHEDFLANTYCVDGKQYGCNVQTQYLGGNLNNFHLVMVLERLEESLALMSIQLGVPVQVLFTHVESLDVSALVDTVQEMSVEFQVRLEQALAVDIANYVEATARLQHGIEALSLADKLRFDNIVSLLQQGNARLASTCDEECGFTQYFDLCMKRCFRRDICWMGLEHGW